MTQDYGNAIRLFREVIKIEPAAKGVWALLALCHKETGGERQALQLEIIDAHLREPDVDLWRDLGRRSR
jgi:general transcription factor 3C polypeptide 3 (transcription factor C subunit 4)